MIISIIKVFNKKISVPYSVRILMEDIWKLSEDLNLYIYSWMLTWRRI